MNQTGQQGTALPSITNQGTADSQPPSVHAPGASSPPIQQPIPQTFAPQENQNNASEFFPHAQSRGPETSSLPKNNLAQQICSRQQINCFPRAPNATLPPFPTTNHPVPVINVPLHPSAHLGSLPGRGTNIEGENNLPKASIYSIETYLYSTVSNVLFSRQRTSLVSALTINVTSET